MAGINHPVVSGQGLAGTALRAAGAIGRGVASLGRTASHAVAADAAVTAVNTLAGDGTQGIVSFELVPERDTERVGNVREMTEQDLANSLRIEPRPNIASMSPEESLAFAQRDADGTAVANELLLRLALSDAQSDTINNVFVMKSDMSVPDGNALASRVPDTILEPLLDASSAAIQESELSPENRRRISNRTLDGRRVSREYCEFQYCRSSGQIGSALNFLQLWDAGNFQNINSDTVGEGYGQEMFDRNDISQDDISYGQFVDMVCFRRFIALRRGLFRKVRAANVTCILSLANPPIDPELLARDILIGGDHRRVIEEINRTHNENVRLTTNQQLCSADGGATRLVADRREQMQEFGSGGQGQL